MIKFDSGKPMLPKLSITKEGALNTHVDNFLEHLKSFLRVEGSDLTKEIQCLHVMNKRV